MLAKLHQIFNQVFTSKEQTTKGLGKNVQMGFMGMY
jgi:hypothetical protein